jgi:hypothetical protein
VVVLLRGYAASAGHLAVARDDLTRERRRMKEHAWKLIPVALSNAHRHAPTHSPSRTSRNNDVPRVSPKITVFDALSPSSWADP